MKIILEYESDDAVYFLLKFISMAEKFTKLYYKQDCLVEKNITDIRLQFTEQLKDQYPDYFEKYSILHS